MRSLRCASRWRRRAIGRRTRATRNGRIRHPIPQGPWVWVRSTNPPCFKSASICLFRLIRVPSLRQRCIAYRCGRRAYPVNPALEQLVLHRLCNPGWRQHPSSGPRRTPDISVSSCLPGFGTDPPVGGDSSEVGRGGVTTILAPTATFPASSANSPPRQCHSVVPTCTSWTIRICSSTRSRISRSPASGR